MKQRLIQILGLTHLKTNFEDFELIVEQGRRPFWMLVVASLMFTYALYLTYEIWSAFYNTGFDFLVAVLAVKCLKSIIYCIIGGISYSVRKTILIDVDKDLLISRFNVGVFSKDIKSTVPNLDYVSVFLNGKEEFEVNLWYGRNNHYKMYVFDEKEAAMKVAHYSASKLGLDLLDATEKGNSKWIDQSIYNGCHIR